MRKGVSIFHMIIFLVILLMVGLGYVYFFAYTEVVNFEKGLKEATVIEGTNIMELLQKNLQQALRYSYYQSSFEVSKNGDNLESLQTWRNYEDISFPSNFEKTLEDRTLEIFNGYSKSLSEDGITTIDYTSLDVVKKADGEYVSALAKKEDGKDKELEVSKSSFYMLFNKANTFILVLTRTFDLFGLGRLDFVDKDGIGDAVKNAEQSIDNACRQIVVSTCENQPVNCESQLSNKCGDIDSKFKAGIDTELTALEKNENGIELRIKSREITTKHTPSSDSVLGSQDSSCGCKLGKERLVTIEVPCTKEELEQNPDKKCTTSTVVCDEYYRRVTVTCSYSFFGSAKVSVEIKDVNNKYPVYYSALTENSGISMQNIQLNFNLISGNDYSRKLIQ